MFIILLITEYVPFENMAPGQFRPEHVRQSHGELLNYTVKKQWQSSDDNCTKETVGKRSRLVVIMTVSYLVNVLRLEPLRSLSSRMRGPAITQNEQEKYVCRV